jgi:hypothetical protein
MSWYPFVPGFRDSYLTELFGVQKAEPRLQHQEWVVYIGLGITAKRPFDGQCTRGALAHNSCGRSKVGLLFVVYPRGSTDGRVAIYLSRAKSLPSGILCFADILGGNARRSHRVDDKDVPVGSLACGYRSFVEHAVVPLPGGNGVDPKILAVRSN